MFGHVLQVGSLKSVFTGSFGLQCGVRLSAYVVSRGYLASGSKFSVFFLAVSVTSFGGFSSCSRVMVSVFYIGKLSLGLSVALFLLRVAVSVFTYGALGLGNLIVCTSTPRFGPSG